MANYGGRRVSWLGYGPAMDMCRARIWTNSKRTIEWMIHSNNSIRQSIFYSSYFIEYRVESKINTAISRSYGYSSRRFYFYYPISEHFWLIDSEQRRIWATSNFSSNEKKKNFIDLEWILKDSFLDFQDTLYVHNHASNSRFSNFSLNFWTTLYTFHV